MLNKFTKFISIAFLVTHYSFANNGVEIDYISGDFLDSEALTQHIKILSSDSFQGRKFSSDEIINAQYYITKQLKHLRIEPFQESYLHNFIHKTLFNTKHGKNIIASIKGSSLPNQYIVLSAHYDHLGKKYNGIYNGADDNASGVSALLAIGHKLSIVPLHHSVILLFTDGEEANLLGAKAFIEEQKLLIPHIKLNINIDMIAGNKRTRHLQYVSKRLDKVMLEEDVDKLSRITTKIKLKNGFRSSDTRMRNRHAWYNASDHSVFNNKKIPFIYYGVGTHSNYHTVKDTFDNINLKFFMSSSATIYKQLRFIDNSMLNKNLTN